LASRPGDRKQLASKWRRGERRPSDTPGPPRPPRSSATWASTSQPSGTEPRKGDQHSIVPDGRPTRTEPQSWANIRCGCCCLPLTSAGFIPPGLHGGINPAARQFNPHSLLYSPQRVGHAGLPGLRPDNDRGSNLRSRSESLFNRRGTPAGEEIGARGTNPPRGGSSRPLQCLVDGSFRRVRAMNDTASCKCSCVGAVKSRIWQVSLRRRRKGSLQPPEFGRQVQHRGFAPWWTANAASAS